MRGACLARFVAVAVTAAILAACSASKGATGGGSTPTGACASAAPGGVLGPACDTQGPAARVVGAGENSVQPFYTKAFYTYGQANKGVSVDYSPLGSSVGVTDIQQETVAFGQSGVPMPVPASGQGGTILQLPVALGGVAVSYNIPGVGQGLKLDAPTLAGIYTGSITSWDDPAVKALNAGTTLPHLAIVAVHRADSSAPGYDLDQYLISAAGAAWTAKAGAKAATRWPVATIGIGQQLNTGVANYVQQTSGAIGYVEFAYALQAKFTNAALKNASGAFVAPSIDSIGQAGAQASGLSDANFNIVNGPGAGTYPVANFSWALLYEKASSNVTSIVLGKLFDWVTTTGQQDATGLGFSPLPANVAAAAHQTLLKLETTDGTPLFS